jgi:hypothetical protein
MNTTARYILCLNLLSITFGLQAADDAWPAIPSEKLVTKQSERRTTAGIRIESIDFRRGSNRIAQLQKIDRNGDGIIREFTFSAFVGTQRLYVLSRIGGTNESSQFISNDDAIVMTDVQFPESKLTALIVVSKQHGCYEVFTRQPAGYYLPADENAWKIVDAYFRKTAQSLAPLQQLQK